MARFEDCGLVAAHEATVEARDWSAQAWGADGDGRDDAALGEAVNGAVVSVREWAYFPNGLQYAEGNVCMDDFPDVWEEEEEDDPDVWEEEEEDDVDSVGLKDLPAADVMQAQYAETERVTRIRRREPAKAA